LKEQLQAAEVEIEIGTEKSEFAVFVDDVAVFSRLEERRFPETDELVEICTKIVEQ